MLKMRTEADFKVKSDRPDRIDLCFLLGQDNGPSSYQIGERMTDSVRPCVMGASLLMQ